MALLACVAASAQPADFSGVWMMDASRSESAHQDVPIGPVTLVIRQSPAQLTVETRRSDKKKRAASSEVLTFNLDGTEKTESAAGGELKTTAHWDGPKLVIETVRNVQGSTVTTRQIMSLDETAKELTVNKTLTVQHGYQFEGANNTGRGTDVFVKRH
jgi:hypothetical protein